MPGPNDQQLKPATPHPEDVATRWMWLGVFLPIAFGAWVPLAAGYRARHRPTILSGDDAASARRRGDA
ncbi:MAG: hypothetical protein WKF48_06450 [Solirubrobacteraceae bacterium]